jgi:hypothetical protein
MRFFGFKWFGQTNPSRLLINILKYFRFLFRIRQDILLFVHSAYSQYTYRFIPCILCVQTDSFRVFSVYRFIWRILSIRTAKFSLNNYLIPPILRIRRDSFHIFSVYKQIHSAYSQYTNRFIPRIRRMRPNNFECLELIHIHYSF